MATTLSWPSDQSDITGVGYIIELPGLVGYYTFDATDQTKDSSGKKNPATLVNITSVAGYYGQAVAFMATTSSMTITW